MKRYQHGFTLIEITAVLVLMAIISAYVIGRSINTEQIDLAAQTDKIRTQIRYAQSTAMKRSDRIWGIKCDSGAGQYWFFYATDPVDANEPDLAAQQVILPGENNKKISLADLGIDDMNPSFTLFFDRFGRPFSAYTDEAANSPLNNTDNTLTINLTTGTQSRKLSVIAETGLVRLVP
jgi:prepilin-type N-terminal cleavage/methylation domain-containing protein